MTRRPALLSALLVLTTPARAWNPTDVGLPFNRPERPFLLVDAERRMLPGAPASVRVQLRGGGTVRVATFRLRDPEPWARRAQEPDGIAIAGDAVGHTCEALLRTQGPLPRRDGALELVRDESLTLTPPAAVRRTPGVETEAYDSSDSDEGSVETRWVHAGRWSDQRVSLGVLPEGLYLVRVHAGAYAASALVSVSDLTLLVRRGDRHDVVATATADGTPLPNVEVSVSAPSGDGLVRSPTDAHGELRLDAADAFQRRFVAHRGDAWAWADASHARLDACDVRVYLDPGRPVFRRGETLHLRGHARACVNGRDVPLARVSVTVQDHDAPHPTPSTTMLTDADGNFVTEYSVETTELRALVRGRSHVRTIVIDDRALPPRALVVTADRGFAAAGETVRVRASDDAGRWPTEATVTFELMGQRRQATVGPDHAAEVSFVVAGVNESAHREVVTASLAHDGRITQAQTEVWTGRNPVLLHVESAGGGSPVVWTRAENLGGEALARGLSLRVFGSDGNRAVGAARWSGRVETAASGDARAEVQLPGAGPWWVTVADERGEAAETGTVVWERERPPGLGSRGSLSVRPSRAVVVAGESLPVDVTRPARGATWVTLEQSGVWASAWIPAGPPRAGQAWWQAVLGVPADASGGASVVATHLAAGAVEGATVVAGVSAAPPLALRVETDARVYAEGARMHAVVTARSPDGAPRDGVLSLWLADAGYWDLSEERYPAVDAMLMIPGRPASGADSARPRHWGADEGRHLDPHAHWDGHDLPNVTRYDAWNAGGNLVTFDARGTFGALANALARAAGLRSAVVCESRARTLGTASLDATDVPWDLLADRVATRTDTHAWVSGDVLHLSCEAGPSVGFGGLGSGSGYGAGGGGRGSGTIAREQRLEGDLFFLGARHLGASGRLELDIPLPAHPGRWRLQALAIDERGRGDRAFAVVATSRALTASVDAPTMLRPGDRSSGGLTVHAPSLAGQRVEVVLEGEGVTLESAPGVVTLDARGDARVAFTVTATRAGAATIVGRARVGSAQDAVRAGITVRDDDAVQPMALRYTVAGEATDVDVAVPALSRVGELRVSVDTGAVAQVDEALASLSTPRWAVPFAMVERLASLQTLSSVIDALPEAQRRERSARVRSALVSMEAQLRSMRGADGAVGWWRTSPSSGWVTATLLVGLGPDAHGAAWRDAWTFLRERAAVAHGDEAARIVEALATSRTADDQGLSRALLAGLAAETTLSLDATRGAYVAARRRDRTTAARWSARLTTAVEAVLGARPRVTCGAAPWFVCYGREQQWAGEARAMAALVSGDAASVELRARMAAWLAARPASTASWWWGSSDADVAALRVRLTSAAGASTRFTVRVGGREVAQGDAAHPATLTVREAGTLLVSLAASPGRLARVGIDGALALAPVTAPTGTVALERRIDVTAEGPSLALRWTLAREATGVELVVPLPAGVEVARMAGGRARVRATEQELVWWGGLDRGPSALRPTIERRDGALVLRMDRLNAGAHALTLPLVASATGHFTAGGAWLRSDDPTVWSVTPPVVVDTGR